MNQFIIVIDGPIASGKTTVAKLLHAKLKRTAHVSLDRIKHLISDYKPTDKDKTLATQIAAGMIKEYLKHGISVIVENAFIQSKYVERFVKLENRKRGKNAVAVFVYQIEVPLHIGIKRAKKREQKTNPLKKISITRIKRNHTRYKIYRYTKPTRVFQSDKLSAKQIAREILRKVATGKKSI